MDWSKQFTLLIFLILMAMAPYKLKSAEVPIIRVKIGGNLPFVKISGKGLSRKLIGERRFKKFKGRKSIKLLCHNLKLSKKILAQKKGPIVVAEIQSEVGILRWKKNLYRGSFSVLTSRNKKGCDLINHISLEKYLSSLLSKEMKSKWPLEALKAQAIAARSYAYHKITSREVAKRYSSDPHYDIENSERHQVVGTYFDETNRTTLATRLTKGRILIPRNHQIIPIFFHAKCGGRTWLPEHVWENSVPGYSSVICPYCRGNGRPPWMSQLSQVEVKKVLNYTLKNQGHQATLNQAPLHLVPDRLGREKLRMYNDDSLVIVKKALFRRVLGRIKVPGNNFTIQKEGNSFHLAGDGNGHGVGLCQYGAFEMAKRGKSYKKILAHYFPKLGLKKIY